MQKIVIASTVTLIVSFFFKDISHFLWQSFDFWNVICVQMVPPE